MGNNLTGVTMSDIRCGHCRRQLSSAGDEIGLTVYDKKKGKWETRCAMTSCAGIPMDLTVGQLQNYWLNLAMGGKDIMEVFKEAGFEVSDGMRTHPLDDE